MAGRWSPGRLWRRFLHNLLPKLLALGTALTLWFVATTDRRANVEQAYDVPVTVSDTTAERGAGERAVRDLNPPTVRVYLSGRPERLRELRGDSIEAVVDVTGVPEGSFTRPVRVQAPTGTALQRLVPERVQGFVDALVTRTLGVTLSVANPPENSLPRYEVTPAQVIVSGPGRVVATAARVVNAPVSPGPGETREAALIALDERGEPVAGLTLTPASVTVRRVDRGEVPVKTLPVVLGDPPPGLRVTALSVQPAGVRVVADPELLARLREIPGRVPYRVGSYSAPVTLQLPAGAQALEQVSVRLTVQEAAPESAGEEQAP
ncbi:CdaR family protein [Deinococcus sp. MIMF12]|uniref:CdaR family protein n=1 Tax=Deinococcus rhizophilus TaxID=3049544 RepID=A0ABT7JGT4_9DEIO|nr:CdaR family protein [Deinococcus rhizophilus]MDL2344266.1 CdaR family protein [Deinococcus rhizophilus]